MIKVNILSPELIKKEERNEILVIAWLVVVAFVVVFGLNYMGKQRSYAKLEERLSQSQRELGKYESIVKQVEALQGTKKVLETKKNVINSLMANRIVYPQFMEDVLSLTPANVWYKSMNTQLQSDGNMNITLTAESLDNYSISDFVNALLVHSSFQNVELGAISTSSTGGKNNAPTSVFQLTFGYKKIKQ